MDNEAVTPVVGTVMVLGITILGIGAIMLWGAPTLQAIQDQNALTAMEGEFLEMRRDTLDLTVDKASRLPTVVMEAGQLSIEKGSRFMILHDAFSNPDPSYDSCSFAIEGWADGNVDEFSIPDPPSCTAIDVGQSPTCPAGVGQLCVEVEKVVGSTHTAKSWTSSNGITAWDITVTGEDLESGDWVIRVLDDAGDTMGEAWILGTHRISWHLTTSASDHQLYLEGGAVFRRTGTDVFLSQAPALQEDAFSSGDYVLRIPTYIDDDLSTVSGRISPSVFFGQVGNNHLRVSITEATRIHYEFSGDLAESWCRTILARNTQLTGASYAEPAGGGCDVDVTSLDYSLDSGLPFNYELIHARVTTRIQL